MKKIMVIAVSFLFTALMSNTTVWRGNVVLNDDYTVQVGDVLIIEAGTRVGFGNQVTLTVQGEIKVYGDPSNPVLFSNYYALDSNWGGIILENTTALNEFSHAVFIGAGDTPLVLMQSNAVIHNCIFRGNSGMYGKPGALKIVGGNVTVDETLFENNYGSYGGAVHVYNNSLNSLSQIDILNSQFIANEGQDGGAIYILDKFDSPNNMHIKISKCTFTQNRGYELGGALYYDNKGKIDLEFEKSLIFTNSAFQGSGIFMSFMEEMPGPILAQKFRNLIVFMNKGYYQSGIQIDMGQTQNPNNITFTNINVVYNFLEPSKEEKNQQSSGIFIRSFNGNAPIIRNSILWGNRDLVGPSNFFIQNQGGGLHPDNVFNYCNIEQYFTGEGTNISQNPLFVRPPDLTRLYDYPRRINKNRFDFHVSLLSPCIDAGDPMSPFENEPIPNGERVNIGAYGNTAEATRSTYDQITPTANTTIGVPDNSALVLNFEGKKGNFDLEGINLGMNSEVYLRSAQNVSLNLKSLTTSPVKFDGGFVRIQTLVEQPQGLITPPQTITVTENLQLINTNLNDITIQTPRGLKNTPPTVLVSNSQFFNNGNSQHALLIEDASNIIIENSQFVDFNNGIVVGTVEGGDPPLTKASGRITNNTVSFDVSEATKNKSSKQVGIQISGASIDIEDNIIDGGTEGIMMTFGSSGRITNNTVSFNVSEATKNAFVKKGISVSENSVSNEISFNKIISDDWENSLDIIGIEIDNSSGSILYNTMRFTGFNFGPRKGVRINEPSNAVNVINNTILNPGLGFEISSNNTVTLINNIYWSDSFDALNISDTTNVVFYNNLFKNPLPEGYVGSGNIFEDDPNLSDPWNSDYNPVSFSPCINAGMIVEGVHVFSEGKSFPVVFYGSAPEIGAYEYYEEGVNFPENIVISVTETEISFGWDPLPGYDYYAVYASDNPYSGFTKIATVTGFSFSEALTGLKKFYYVVGTTDPPEKFYSGSADLNIMDSSKDRSINRMESDRKTLPVRIKNNSNLR